MTKKRITVTIDEELVVAAEDAVAMGKAHSVSAWVNDAIAAKVDRERGLDGLRQLVADYEAIHGVITDEEIEAQKARDADASAKVWARLEP